MSRQEQFESNLEGKLQTHLAEELSKQELDTVIKNLESTAVEVFANSPELIVETFHSVYQKLSDRDITSDVENILLKNSLNYIRCIELHCILKKVMGSSFNPETHSISALSQLSEPLSLNVNDFIAVADIRTRDTFTRLELLRELDECRQLGLITLNTQASTPEQYAQALLFQTYYLNWSQLSFFMVNFFIQSGYLII